MCVGAVQRACVYVCVCIYIYIYRYIYTRIFSTRTHVVRTVHSYERHLAARRKLPADAKRSREVGNAYTLACYINSRRFNFLQFLFLISKHGTQRVIYQVIYLTRVLQ